VLDGVGVVWTSLFEELFEVVCGRPRLTLAAACGHHGVHHTRAACLFVGATIIIGRGCGLLVVVLAPLLVALGALLGILDGDVE
jgi:hypothetical protein